MRSAITRGFREAFSKLPDPIRQQARRAYGLFRQNPSHPGLGFKKVDNENNTYSVRIGLGYRALGQLDGDCIVWFWIGPHAEYDRRL
jgi:mRNA-degrading endonuclease RelE of RelBE toxin-antitoxin system